jgi:pseudaminic acid synthase
MPNFTEITATMSNKVLIIAELSANHNHNYKIAEKTIKEMAAAGADAVKLQTYTADTLTMNCDNEYFRIQSDTIWDGKTLYELYKEAYTPWEWQPKLKKLAESLGMICFSSPFDNTAVDFLEKMDVPMYKIASFEITDIPLIEYTASKRKPMIISTGVASYNDIVDALEACRRAGNNDISLLKCTSAYPAPVEDANLLTIQDMKENFGVKCGLSDHSLGDSVAIAAVALGAEIVEKHFILDRKMGGPDSAFSMEPEEFKQMVLKIREVEKALGKVSYELSDKVKKSRIFTRSLFAVEDIKQGDMITYKNVKSIRPGYGLSPKYLPSIVGKTANTGIKKGLPIKIEYID